MNSKQQRIYNILIKKTNGIYVVKGHAGTGKTYLAIEIIKNFLEQDKKVGIVCPTHQAKIQFVDNLVPHENLKIMTVASYMAQYPTRMEDTGKLIFKKGYGRNLGFDLLIIDEASMISEYEISELSFTKNDCVIVFFGDFAQLIPVMKKRGRIDYLISFALTEQQRNANSILQLCEQLRLQLLYPTNDTENIKVHSSDDAMIRHFLNRLRSDSFDICYAAYRNRQVDMVRVLAHKVLYGNNVFMRGQYLRLDKGCGVGYNGSIVKVINILMEEKRIIADIPVTVYSIWLHNIHNRNTNMEEMISFDDQNKLKVRQEELYEESKMYFERKVSLWKECQDKIIDIEKIVFYSSPYVSTVHKLQSRSVPVMYVDTLDISTGSNRQRLMYVACSRAMKELHTIQIKR